MMMFITEILVVAGLVVLLCDDLADAIRYWPYPAALLATLHLMLDGPGWIVRAAWGG